MWKKFTLALLFCFAMRGGMAVAESFDSLDAIINVDKQIRDYKHDKKMRKKEEKRRERREQRRRDRHDDRRDCSRDHHNKHR